MRTKKIVNYVAKRNNNLSEYKNGNLNILIKDPIEADIDIQNIFHEIRSIIPDPYLNLIDVIYIGQFSFLEDKEANAMYQDGAIYISNIQDDSEDLKDDIVHEISHAVESKHGDVIYSDNLIKREFLHKRKQIENILQNQGYETHKYNFSEIEYNLKFDNFLYEIIGYDLLRMLTVDIFLGPYSITSLREYFARGFEEYYLGKQLYLKEICPYVFNKLMLLEQQEELEYEF